MSRFNRIILLALICIGCVSTAQAYEQRFLNLGITSFMDGMPLPNGEGFYLFAHDSNYTAFEFKNSAGQNLPSTYISNNGFLAQLLYQSNLNFLGGKLGAHMMLIYVSNIDLPPNPLGLTTSGSGFDDLNAGVFVQWNPVFYQGRPFMANRVELTVYFPTGKNQVNRSINPGNNHYSYEPYWAATVFILPRWTVSWRLHYIFNAANDVTGIQPGDTFHANFATSFEVVPKLRLGVAGYYLKQTQNSRINGTPILNSKEQVFAIGPGLLAAFSKSTLMTFNVYRESHVTNRPSGTRIVFGLLANL